MEKTDKNKIHTDKELAKLAGVGSGTVARYDTVHEWAGSSLLPNLKT